MIPSGWTSSLVLPLRSEPLAKRLKGISVVPLIGQPFAHSSSRAALPVCCSVIQAAAHRPSRPLIRSCANLHNQWCKPGCNWLAALAEILVAIWPWLAPVMSAIKAISPQKQSQSCTSSPEPSLEERRNTAVSMNHLLIWQICVIKSVKEQNIKEGLTHVNIFITKEGFFSIKGCRLFGMSERLFSLCFWTWTKDRTHLPDVTGWRAILQEAGAVPPDIETVRINIPQKPGHCFW